jgi:hypothetical protein
MAVESKEWRSKVINIHVTYNTDKHRARNGPEICATAGQNFDPPLGNVISSTLTIDMKEIDTSAQAAAPASKFRCGNCSLPFKIPAFICGFVNVATKTPV